MRPRSEPDAVQSLVRLGAKGPRLVLDESRNVHTPVLNNGKPVRDSPSI